MARYHVPPSANLQPAQIKVVRLRVINAFKSWLKTRFDDFTSETLAPVWEFIEELRRDGQWTAAADTLARLIETKMNEVMRRNEIESEKKERGGRSGLSLSRREQLYSPTEFLFVVDAVVIAQQLSRFEFSIWKKVRPSELMKQAWLKPELKHKAPHVCELISRFNSVSHWVASVILWHEKLQDRVKVVMKLIDLAAVPSTFPSFLSLLTFRRCLKV